MLTKRILALVMTLAMCLCALPAVAASPDQAAGPAAGQEILRATRDNGEATEDILEKTEISLPEPEIQSPGDPDAGGGDPLAVRADRVAADLRDTGAIPSGDMRVVINSRGKSDRPSYTAPARSRGAASTGDFGGSGTEADPFKITSAGDLVKLADIVNSGDSLTGSYFRMTGDIDLSSVCGGESGWVPVGYGRDIVFNGIFDGGGFTVSGLTIESGDYAGLFGTVAGTVRNLIVSGSVSGENCVGGVAGYSYGSIENCAFSGSVTGSDYVGGIVGCSGKDGAVSGCSSSATVNGCGTGIGGVVGWANNVAGADDRADELSDADSNDVGTGTVENCTFTGTLTGRSPFGTGTVSGGESSGTITITVTDNAFGGIVGWNNGCAVAGCMNSGAVYGDDFVGGIVGDSTNGGTVTNCVNTGAVTGASMLNGGIAGRIAEGKISGCRNSGSVTGGDFTGGIAGHTDKNSTVSDCSCEDGGEVTGAKYVGGVAGLSNCALTSCRSWGSVIGEYGVGGIVGWTTRSVVDCHAGSGSAVTATGENGRAGGVVGNSYGAVEDCSNDGEVHGTALTGGIVGYLLSSVKNCENTGTVSGADGVGGIAGSADARAAISGCTNDGDVSGGSCVGGVAGVAHCVVSSCSGFENGSVSGTGSEVGGVIGYLDEDGRGESLVNAGSVSGDGYVGGVIGLSMVDLSRMENSGQVTGHNYTGGIAGFANNCSYCINSGTVTGESFTGGVTGGSGGELYACSSSGSVNGNHETGGVSGAATGIVSECYSRGEVTANGVNTGGVVGYIGADASVSDSYNEGSVYSTSDNVGGVVGSTASSGEIKNCRNRSSGSVTGGQMTGGIVGYTGVRVTGSSNEGSVTGSAATGGIAGAAASSAPIDGCTNQVVASVTSEGSSTGGIAGIAFSAVTSCRSLTEVTGGEITGGIVGNLRGDGVVSACQSAGSVRGGGYTGGIVGLIGETDDGADPSGLVEKCVNSATVSGGAVSGGVAGFNHGVIRECENSAGMSGSNTSVGGIAGANWYNSVIEDCNNRGAVTAGGDNTGGIVGTSMSTVKNCVNYAAVAGGGYSTVGGVAGASGGTLDCCTNRGNVSGNTHVGGVAGVSQGTITGCANVAQITNTADTIGGIVGESGGPVSGCTNTGRVTSSQTSGSTYAGGVAGRCYGDITGCTNSAQITAGAGVGGIVGIFSGSKTITDCTNSGYVSAPAGCAGGIVGSLQNNCNISGCQNTNTVNGSGKKEIGGIVGQAGSGNTISDCINKGSVSGVECVGGIIGINGSSGTYSKLTNNGSVSGGWETGGIIGDATASIIDCLNTGSVTGSGSADGHGTGGIAGRLSGRSGSAERCKNTGTISSDCFGGGIVGIDNNRPISGSLNQGPVTCRLTSDGDAWIGGIVGYISDTTVSKCVNYVSIDAGSHANLVGGIAGSAVHVTIDECRNYSTISGRVNVGGIAGLARNDGNNGSTVQRCINTGHVNSTTDNDTYANAGGIVGKADWYTLINPCANNNPNAQVSAAGHRAGGIVGYMYNCSVTNCYNKGKVGAYNRAGGIVGEIRATSKMENCYNYAGGNVITCTFGTYRGALIGQYAEDTTTLTHNYYMYYLALPPTGHVIAATASSPGHYDYYMSGNFNVQSNFTGFDFSSVWYMGSETPLLRMEGGVAKYDNTGPTSSPSAVPTEINIYSAQDLASFRDKVNAATDYSKTTIRLCRDIDLDGMTWVPIGTDSAVFNGVFDGQGHTVYNMTVNTGVMCAGFFGASQGTIRNLEVHGSVNSSNTSTGYAGGIVAASVGGTVDSCAFYGNVITSTSSLNTMAGGVVGVIQTATVSNCYHLGNVAGCAAGGVIGYVMSGTVENCFHYTGSISSNNYPGGVAGLNVGTLRNCFALSGATSNAVAYGGGTNVSFKSAAEFKGSGLITAGGWSTGKWIAGGDYPELKVLCHTVDLDPNGGNGSTTQYGVRKFRGTIPYEPFGKDGNILIGWNTASDGSGTPYGNCGEVDGNVTLYAQWMAGTPYLSYYSDYASAMLGNSDSTVWTCYGMGSGGFDTVEFSSDDAIRPCAVAFKTAGSPTTPPAWRLEGTTHQSGGAWVTLAEGDGAALSQSGKVLYFPLYNVGDDFYSFYRLVFSGPSDSTDFLEAYLLVGNYGADVRNPIILHSNDPSGSSVPVDCKNGFYVQLENPFVSDAFFLGWNTEADGSGKSYINCDGIEADGVLDLYAQWLDGTRYRSYTAIKAYDELSPVVDGVVQDDSQYRGYDTQEYDCLVDDNINTKWCVSVRSGATWSLEFATDDYVAPVGYVLVTGEDTSRYPGRNPRNWRLEGRGEDGEWVLIDESADNFDLPAANHAEICRPVSGSGKYCCFRISFSKLKNGLAFQLSEMYLITDGDARQPAVTFDGHGGDGVTERVSGRNLSTVTLPGSSFTRAGYDFAGWNTAPDGSGKAYSAGGGYQIDGDSTLYAQWTPANYTVTFVGEGGATLYETTVASGQLPVYAGEAPTKKGNAEFAYVFSGWDPVITPVDGAATYTARFDAAPHTYSAPAWNWSDDHVSATATFTANSDPDIVERVETHEVTAVTTAPTCTEDGYIEYTATVTFLGGTYKNTVTVPVAKLGHSYALTGWEWTGHDAATATFTCERDASHVTTADAIITSARTEPGCEKEGKTVYTATVTFEGKTYADKSTEAIAAAGHDWGVPVYEWSDDFSTVRATVTCKRDASHKVTETATSNFILTHYSTYKKEGTGRFVASFNNKLFREQIKVITIPAVSCDGGPTCPSIHFTDMPSVKNWTHIPVDWAVVNRVTVGTSATTFSPDSVCTRAQFVTFLWRTLGQPKTNLRENPFTDVHPGDWFYTAVLWAYENNITLGTSATTFSPDKLCSRAQVVSFLWRIEGYEKPTNTGASFDDVHPSDWYYDAIMWAVEKEITSGTSKTTFSPGNPCTRVQCVAFIYREFGR